MDNTPALNDPMILPEPTSVVVNPKLRKSAQTVDWNTRKQNTRTSKIMIVDDEDLVIRVVKRFLGSDGYNNFVTLTDPRQALSMMRIEEPDVVLLDVNMPHISGLEILKERQFIKSLRATPFIILSASSDAETKQLALELGATDFLAKPVDRSDLTLRIQNALIVKRHFDNLSNHADELERKVRLRTKQLEKSREQVIRILARAAEFRDNETGEHVVRVGAYCAVIAEQLGLPENYCRQIGLAAQLHDVGKIAIPDAVLLNPNKLDREEFEIMKQHCDLGCQIMKPMADEEMELIRNAELESGSADDGESPLLSMASVIARTHHEKWDGTGYPLGLKGDQIPLEGRITCVADVYDALCSDRPYKQAFPVKKSLEIMLSERGTRFDPSVLDAFLERIADIEEIRNSPIAKTIVR
jgi:putative two-component system response regulator